MTRRTVLWTAIAMALSGPALAGISAGAPATSAAAITITGPTGMPTQRVHIAELTIDLLLAAHPDTAITRSDAFGDDGENAPIRAKRGTTHAATQTLDHARRPTSLGMLFTRRTPETVAPEPAIQTPDLTLAF